MPRSSENRGRFRVRDTVWGPKLLTIVKVGVRVRDTVKGPIQGPIRGPLRTGRGLFRGWGPKRFVFGWNLF